MFVIKIGGNILDDPKALDQFLQRFAAIDAPKILVHGGGKIATQMGARLGLQAQYVQGRRITDDATLELVTMVYGGLVNRQLTARLQALGCQSIGLTGADANLLPATIRPLKDGIDYGWVGDPLANKVNTSFLSSLLMQGITPVLSPLTHDEMGHLLNTNADTIAAYIAMAMQALEPAHLIYCFEKRGILSDPDQEDSVLPTLRSTDYTAMQANATVKDGILPKLDNAFAAASKGVNVRIGHADELNELCKINAQAGTKIEWTI